MLAPRAVTGALLALALAGEARAAADPSCARSALGAFRFERNDGQGPPGARFLARGAEGIVAVERGGVRVASATCADVRLTFRGAASAEPEAGEPLPGTVSVLLGDDPSRWVHGAPTCASVIYHDAWPGVAVVLHGRAGELELDLVAAPGSDWRAARLAAAGGVLTLGATGDATIVSSEGEALRLRKPQAWQRDAGGRLRWLSTSWRCEGGALAFDVSGEDTSRELVLDPVVLLGSFAGGGNRDAATAVAVDRRGVSHVVGWTDSLTFPTSDPIQGGRGGSRDGFLMEIAPSGALLSSTYLGGSLDDEMTAVVVDAAGTVHVAGWTLSSNFPTLNAMQSRLGGGEDGVLLRVAAAGDVLTSTYFGGNGDDEALSIAASAVGDSLVGGSTRSINLRTTVMQRGLSGVSDGFVAAVSASGGLTWATYFGGSSDDAVTAVALDSQAQPRVTGWTTSFNFPRRNADQSFAGGGVDAFAAAFVSSGASLQWSTFLGGSGDDAGYGVAVDPASGATWVVGDTASADFPVATPFQAAPGGGLDAFVVRYTAAGALQRASHLGGSRDDSASSVVVDAGGTAHVTGSTLSSNFPLQLPVQGTDGGFGDAFVSHVAASGALFTSSYLGGSDLDAGSGIALDRSGLDHVVGETSSDDFTLRSPFQPSPGGGFSDGFVATLAPGTLADPDADTVPSTTDDCDFAPDPLQADFDHDRVGDACDDCVLFTDAAQGDADLDGLGDACEFAWGDAVPRGSPNGIVDIADVVLLLRMAVGLDVPTAEERKRLDVAPARIVASAGLPDVATPLVATPSVLDVTDVVLLLRVTVGLARFASPS